MSEAVLDDAIEQIADGLTVDWNALDQARAPDARARVGQEPSRPQRHRQAASRRGGGLRPDHAGDGGGDGARRRRAGHVGQISPDRQGWRGQLRQRLSGVGFGARTRRGDQDPASSCRRYAAAGAAAAGRPRARQDPAQQRRPRARHRGARRSRRPVHGVRAREDAGRRRAWPGQAERGAKPC